jgi:hypothetical protein
MFKGKAKKNSYLFCISRSGKDKIKIFKANEIYGYKIMNDYYVQHMSDGNYFFIRKTKTGKIDLFEREIIPSDNRFLYLLKFPNNNSYFVINPTENNITEQRMPDTRQPESSGATVLYIASKGINEKFKIFVSIYLGDCYQIKNMVNSEFYTIKDIPIIIETYNNCLN